MISISKDTQILTTIFVRYDVVNAYRWWDRGAFSQFRHLSSNSETNLTLFGKTPCILPVWDPGSPSGLALTCLGTELMGGRRMEDDQVMDRVSWIKVK